MTVQRANQEVSDAYHEVRERLCAVINKDGLTVKTDLAKHIEASFQLKVAMWETLQFVMIGEVQAHLEKAQKDIMEVKVLLERYILQKAHIVLSTLVSSAAMNCTNRSLNSTRSLSTKLHRLLYPRLLSR